MKKLAIALVLLTPVMSSAQDVLELSDRVYNVYRRDSALIYDYNKDFANSLKKKDSVTYSDAVIAHAKLVFPGKPCLGDVILQFDIKFESKDNRSRVSFLNSRYESAKGDCPREGTLKELIDCKDCGVSADFIKTQYLQYIRTVYETYHDYLKRKTKDGNW